MTFTKEQELLGTIISKAWDDAQFKQELIADPVAAIEKLTGEKVDLPGGKTLVVRDQTDESAIYINIPAKQELSDVELTEDQLEAVSGGIGSITLPWLPSLPTIPIRRPVEPIITFPVTPVIKV